MCAEQTCGASTRPAPDAHRADRADRGRTQRDKLETVDSRVQRSVKIRRLYRGMCCSAARNAWGARGPEFKSRRSDQLKNKHFAPLYAIRFRDVTQAVGDSIGDSPARTRLYLQNSPCTVRQLGLRRWQERQRSTAGHARIIKIVYPHFRRKARHGHISGRRH